MIAISAAFADFRIVKGRKVAQFVFETPLEAADEALRMLGGLPRPDAERWVGIAPLKAKPTTVPAPVATDAPPKERRPFHTLPRSQQAAIACADPRFRQWLTDVVNRRIGSPPPGHPPHIETASEAAEEVRLRIGIESRRELDTYETAGRGWDSLYRDFRRDTGLEPEERA